MKKVYVQVKNNYPINVDIQNAIDGFEYLNYEPINFTYVDVLLGKMNLIAMFNPIVGSIDGMISIFKQIKKLPEPIDFPEEILTNSDLIKRQINKMPLNDFIEMYKGCFKDDFFVKPVKSKLFDGILITHINHLNYFKGYDNPDVWVSEKLDIISEYRAFIHKGKIKYCSSYRGDFKVAPDYDYIEQIIKQYTSCPIAYTIDVGVLKNGRTELIEINDMWAIGSYGLYCIDYAEMLSDRYFEIVKNE